MTIDLGILNVVDASVSVIGLRRGEHSANHRDDDDGRGKAEPIHVSPSCSHDVPVVWLIIAYPGQHANIDHGQHLALDSQNNYPRPKLLVSMLQRLGLEMDTFTSCTGTMDSRQMT